MMSDPIEKTMSLVEHMSYETWVSILLAALAVLLAVVTLIVAIAGIAIALIGIWGLRALRKAAEQRAHDAVKQAIAEYPDATQFVKVNVQMKELYRLMRQQMAEFKQEFDVLHQRSEAANEILDRLGTKRGSDASNIVEDSTQTADSVIEHVSQNYPGEESSSNDGNPGKSDTDKTDRPSDAG